MNRDLFDSSRARDAEPAPRASQRAGPAAEKPALTVYGLVAMAKGLLENAYPPMWVYYHFVTRGTIRTVRARAPSAATLRCSARNCAGLQASKSRPSRR